MHQARNHPAAQVHQPFDPVERLRYADGERQVGPVKTGIAGSCFAMDVVAVQHVLEVVEGLVAQAPEDSQAIEQVGLMGLGLSDDCGKNQGQADERDRFAHGDGLGFTQMLREA